MFKLKVIPIVFLSLTLFGCSVSGDDKEKLENILFEEMTSKDVLKREISQENLQLTGAIKDLTGIKENVNLEESLEYNQFKTKLNELKKKSSIEVLNVDKETKNVTVKVTYIDIGKMLSGSLKDAVERAFVSHYKGEIITKEFYDELFDSMNKKIEFSLESDSLEWKTKEVLANTNGKFDLEENAEALTLGISSEISSLIEHFQKLSLEKDFLEVQENFNSIANLYDKSLSSEENKSKIEEKTSLKVQFNNQGSLEDVYYLKVEDSELTISKKHHGEDILYKKTL